MWSSWQTAKEGIWGLIWLGMSVDTGGKLAAGPVAEHVAFEGGDEVARVRAGPPPTGGAVVVSSVRLRHSAPSVQFPPVGSGGAEAPQVWLVPRDVHDLPVVRSRPSIL